MKKVFVVIALILLPTLVFSAANVRSISVAELFFDFVSKTRRSCVQLPALRLTLS
jgi:hypothetical protein